MVAEEGETLGLLNALLRRGYRFSFAPRGARPEGRPEFDAPLDALPRPPPELRPEGGAGDERPQSVDERFHVAERDDEPRPAVVHHFAGSLHRERHDGLRF